MRERERERERISAISVPLGHGSVSLVLSSFFSDPWLGYHFAPRLIFAWVLEHHGCCSCDMCSCLVWFQFKVSAL